ncbi:hypothetical protein FNH22_05860 [Fulvivirga sp. M361]|uniref:DUF5655 domain-containing protein n=1 Tax=Fulvivirga sp. M361 TaxID=2594266 RepID=UPI00117BA738|nr:DUF5655 domain-containing protein [Fulvivirga sp. M361]TRX60574.1 hypothetical protein FNH22_05860 [Fulvivirga sp. M361]
MCTTKDIGELFLGKSDEMVLTFDRIMTEVMLWQPNDLGASIHSVVFTNRKAWLIIKPMKKELDVKFYYSEEIDSPLIKKRTTYPNKFAHHLRVSSELEITAELINLLRMGYDYAMDS